MLPRNGSGRERAALRANEWALEYGMTPSPSRHGKRGGNRDWGGIIVVSSDLPEGTSLARVLSMERANATAHMIAVLPSVRGRVQVPENGTSHSRHIPLLLELPVHWRRMKNVPDYVS